jgi:hypothetical protein
MFSPLCLCPSEGSQTRKVVAARALGMTGGSTGRARGKEPVVRFADTLIVGT